MRTRAVLLLGLLSFATSLFAVDRWVLISGTVSNFHTDARLFNPAFDKDIQISATFYPTDGSGAQTATVSVPKRQMKILDDVTSQLFNTNKLGAILFTSSDNFEATSRIYAQTALGTLGQFGPGTAPSAAKTKGVLLQLKSSNLFRTNIGVVNPNSATANVTWTLYDKSSAVISSKTTPLPPLSALAPTNMAGGFFFDPKGSDMSDAWISYSSDQPILAYASVIDAGTTDQTFIPALDDTGTPPPPAQTGPKSFDVTLQSFSISITPDLSTIKVGDQVVLHIRVIEGDHSFTLVSPSGQTIVPITFPDAGKSAIDRTFTVTAKGTYFYFCTNSFCGIGHSNMSGSFDVGEASPDRGGGY
jgi:plastocyanin